ncbi:MAG: UTP--glucose-1-phosphate uridylyltransferase [Planctomycetes bacterium]|nr:UTP--glucose-1-phosphate uridylyltransferase [Planctomycetota bacterium]
MSGPTEQQLAFLQQYGFDQELQRRWRDDIAAGRLSVETNAVTGDLLVPPPGSVHKLPGAGTKAWRELDRLGREAIARGELGVVVLNGGMATRFGGVVKGVVPVLGPARTFLGLCVEDVTAAERQYGGRIRLFLMNSFATQAATQQHFAEHGQFGKDPGTIEHFPQFVALRMDKKGELFRLASGDLSPYGPGHGDFAAAFRRSGALRRFLDGGGRYLLVRNVDNLGARIDPVILGHHIRSKCQATVELAPKWPEDAGGSPFQYLGRTQLIEQVRYRPGFDPNIVDVFNTNTFWFTADALDRDFDLGWYYVEKEVEGRRAVQVEHLIGELTAHLSTNFLQVRRSGARTRFLPVKTPEDLAAAREEIVEMYGGETGTADAG